MKKELENKLANEYPKIFANINKGMQESAMYWGFGHKDGWYWLIDNLCHTIQSYIDLNTHLNIEQVTATQVKEKFGILRFYYTGGDKCIDGMVALAESMSSNICENCGSTENIGKTKSWIKTLCKTCADKENRTDWEQNPQ